MAIEQTLVPAYVNFMYGGTEFLIVDANISLRFSNSSRFEESITNKGTKGYMLRKGVTVEQNGDISIRVTKTGDNNADGTIKNMQNISKNISKSENPKDYVENIVINLKKYPKAFEIFSVMNFSYSSKLSIAFFILLQNPIFAVSIIYTPF